MENRAVGEAEMEIDLRALFSTLLRKLPFIVLFVALVSVGAFFGLKALSPSYTSQVSIFIDGGEGGLTDATQASAEQTMTGLDEQAITSQVQLVQSRDLARSVANKLDLASLPEFNPALRSASFFDTILTAVGLDSKPSGSVEDQVLRAYFKRLSVYAVDRSRVIVIEFQSQNPELAADVANAIAEGYIVLQREAKRDATANAAKFLNDQIGELRIKVRDAEAKVESFRTENDLFSSGGTNDSTLPQQQLGDLSTELARIRAEQADAKARADQLRAALQDGRTANLPEVQNSPLIQRLVEQQVQLKAQIAQLSATLLPQHPRMRELNAQVRDLDRLIDVEARKIVDGLDNEVARAASREKELNASLTQQKVATGAANGAEVQLRALQREAAAQRDLLDTYLRRYREAVSRQQASLPPADARIVSRAAVPDQPSFPKVVPMTAAAAVAALLLAIAFVLLRELASGRPMRRVQFAEPLPLVPDAMPIGGHMRWADDRSVRRMMPGEPTLAPELVDRVEESLAEISTEIISRGARRALVTLAEGSDENGRPLAAVALARALARADARAVVVDFRGDGANAVSMGEGSDLPGFSDLFDGEASFAQVIFRDRRSRAHFIPAGRRKLSAKALSGERLETILSALAMTYDCVVFDASDAMVPIVGKSADMGIVVSEFGASDPRTRGAFDRIAEVTDAHTMLLVVDPAPAEPELDLEPGAEAAMPREKAPEEEAAA